MKTIKTMLAATALVAMSVSGASAADDHTEAPSVAMTFIKINVTDLDGIQKFYEEAFGFEEVRRVEQDTLEERMLTAPGGGATLVLFHHTDGRAYDMGTGYGPLGLRTDNLWALLQQAEAAGATLTQGSAKEGQKYGFVFVEDPEGHLIELYAPAPAKK